MAFGLTIMLIFIIILTIVALIGIFNSFLPMGTSILRKQIVSFLYTIKKLFNHVFDFILNKFKF